MPFVTPYNPDGSSVYTTEVTGSAPADGMAAAVTQGKAFSQLKQTQYTTTIGGVITPLQRMEYRRDLQLQALPPGKDVPLGQYHLFGRLRRDENGYDRLLQ